MTINWWTIGLQSVNVAILVWLLGRFFWHPLAAMIETRRVTATQTLADAKALNDRAEADRADIARMRSGFAAERESILVTARKDAEQAGAADRTAAAASAAAQQAARAASLGKERDALDAACRAHAAHLAVDIAARLAGRLDGPVVEAVFLDWLLATVRALPEATRQTVLTGQGAITATSAIALDAGEQNRYRDLIVQAFGGQAFGGQAFGGRPAIAFAADPALLAGLELCGPNFILRNSWRADLARILTDLNR